MTRQEIPPWVILEAEKKKTRRPKAPPKPKPVYPSLRVHIELRGSVEFDLDGPDALKLKERLERVRLEDVLDFLDPWASGIETTTYVEVNEWGTNIRWDADEAADFISSTRPDLGPW